MDSNMSAQNDLKHAAKCYLYTLRPPQRRWLTLLWVPPENALIWRWLLRIVGMPESQFVSGA
jgi:hypothetical protein